MPLPTPAQLRQWQQVDPTRRSVTVSIAGEAGTVAVICRIGDDKIRVYDATELADLHNELLRKRIAAHQAAITALQARLT